MNYIRNMNHPRFINDEMVDKKDKFQYHSVCGTKTGWSHCLRGMRKSDMNEYGVGMVLYFQFLKYIGVIMLICTIISAPSILINYHSKDAISDSYNHQIAQFTVGNLGEIGEKVVSSQFQPVEIACDERYTLGDISGIV